MLTISMAWCSKAFIEGKKTVTRRDWTDNFAKQFQRAYERGELIHAYDKQPKFGGKCIGYLRLTASPKQEMLSKLIDDRQYGLQEIAKEGGLWESPEHFVGLFRKDGIERVWRLEFKKVDMPQGREGELF